MKFQFYYKNQLLMRISWTMNDIETTLQERVREFDETVFSKDYRQMEAASAEYEELVKKGFIVPRGYRLLTVGDGTAFQQLELTSPDQNLLF